MASHYVIKDISKAIEDAVGEGNLLESRDVLEKFSRRYSEDIELQTIYGDFQEYIVTRDEGKLHRIVTRLERLLAIRSLETPASVTRSLWYTSRRPGASTVLRTI